MTCALSCNKPDMLQYRPLLYARFPVLPSHHIRLSSIRSHAGEQKRTRRPARSCAWCTHSRHPSERRIGRCWASSRQRQSVDLSDTSRRTHTDDARRTTISTHLASAPPQAQSPPHHRPRYGRASPQIPLPAPNTARLTRQHRRCSRSRIRSHRGLDHAFSVAVDGVTSICVLPI